ncbi:MAG: lysophospholipid acyltransferase family protein [Lachnospiraceae bacterium]
MLRIIYTILRNILHLYLIPLSRYVSNHPEKYSEEKRYRLVQRISYLITKAGHIHTKYFGLENLPDDGNYILCANHQGKFDALAIVNGHKKPVSLVMDYTRSHMYVVNEVMDLLDAKRLKRDDVRQAMSIILEMSEELRAGKKFIIFPEGGYLRDKKNKLFPFKPGCFKCALKAHSKIIPVAIIDSYKAYNTNSLRRVYNSVHFLSPLEFESYKDMNTQEIAQLVQSRIASKISEVKNIPVPDLIVELNDNTSLI